MAIPVGRKKKKLQLRRRRGGKNKKKSASVQWIELPEDVTSNILQRLGPIEVLTSAQKVCTSWHRVCKDPAMWRVIDMADLDGDHEEIMTRDMEIMCRQAVDRSQGQLIDFKIQYFGDDDLLGYVCQRSKHLKCLRIGRCSSLSSAGLRKAVADLAELEELQLFFNSSIIPVDIESIGTACSKLKSLTFNSRPYRFPSADIDNGYALAIAKSIPNLCHLNLIGNKMGSEGLEAILNGCPRLESLDLRQCFNIELRCNVWKKCCEKIKFLRTPCEPTEDYEWDSDHDYESSDSGSIYDPFYDYVEYDYDDFGQEYYHDGMGMYYGYNYF